MHLCVSHPIRHSVYQIQSERSQKHPEQPRRSPQTRKSPKKKSVPQIAQEILAPTPPALPPIYPSSMQTTKALSPVVSAHGKLTHPSIHPSSHLSYQVGNCFHSPRSDVYRFCRPLNIREGSKRLRYVHIDLERHAPGRGGNVRLHTKGGKGWGWGWGCLSLCWWLGDEGWVLYVERRCVVWRGGC